MNIQVLAAPDGTVWTSGSLPGSVHALRAARIWGILRRLAACLRADREAVLQPGRTPDTTRQPFLPFWRVSEKS